MRKWATIIYMHGTEDRNSKSRLKIHCIMHEMCKKGFGYIETHMLHWR